MEKYIAIHHGLKEFYFDVLKKYSFKYVDYFTRTILQITRKGIVYKLNEETMRYEPVINENSNKVLKFIFYADNRVNIKLLKYEESLLVTDKFYTKNLLKNIYFVKKEIIETIDNLATLAKITSTKSGDDENLIVEINKERITVYKTTITYEAIKSILDSHQIEHALAPAPFYGAIKVSIRNNTSIYDFEKINSKLSIPLESIEKLKKEVKIIPMDITVNQDEYHINFEVTVKEKPYYRFEFSTEQVALDNKHNIDPSTFDLETMKAIYSAMLI